MIIQPKATIGKYIPIIEYIKIKIFKRKFIFQRAITLGLLVGINICMPSLPKLILETSFNRRFKPLFT